MKTWVPPHPRADKERMFRCFFCQDTGVAELAEGTAYTTDKGNKAVASKSGPGAVTRCNGPQDQGCPYMQHRAEEARRRKGKGDADAAGGEVRYS